MTTDFVGKAIVPGCHIVYPVRRGSDMQLKRMKVVEVTPRKISGHNPNGRRTHVTDPSRVVVVELPNAVQTNQEQEVQQRVE